MSHSHQHDHHHHQQHKKKKGVHKNSKTWVVIVLMLASMLVYVLSFDLSNPQELDGPEGTQGEMPAAAE